MTSTHDPRNIFVDRRNGYAQNSALPNDDATSQESTTSQDNGAPFSANAQGNANFKGGTNTTSQGNGRSQGTATSQEGAAQSQTYEQRVQQMKALAAKYQREGEGQLVKDIVNNVIEQKARGQLTNQQLVTFANRVMPLLNAEQKGRLGDLLEQLLKL